MQITHSIDMDSGLIITGNKSCNFAKATNIFEVELRNKKGSQSLLLSAIGTCFSASTHHPQA